MLKQVNWTILELKCYLMKVYNGENVLKKLSNTK